MIIVDSSEVVAATYHLDVEVLPVLRRYTLAEKTDSKLRQQAIEYLAGLPVTRYPRELFLHRMSELRQNITAHDAVWVAPAGALGTILATRDERLAAAARHRATKETICIGSN